MMKLRNNENIISFIIILSVLILVSGLWLAFKNPALNPRLEKVNYSILQKWELPSVLEEVSGIVWLTDGRLGCIQDERGTVFIYNLNTMEVEREIDFGGPGDYESITKMDNTLYVLRSDGTIFEINDYTQTDVLVKHFDTPFSERNNMESLTADPENNRLLMVAKDRDLHSRDNIGIYAFHLNTKTVQREPIITIDHNDPIFQMGEKDDPDRFRPAEIRIHPLLENIYIVDGKSPRLLILDKNGDPLNLYKLRKKTFNQPEGIAFSPRGDLYISNEGKMVPPVILQVALDK